MLIRKSDAIEFFGGQSALARKLGCSQAAISQWGEFVPKGRAYEINEITGGAIPKVSDDKSNEAA